MTIKIKNISLKNELQKYAFLDDYAYIYYYLDSSLNVQITTNVKITDVYNK